MAAASPNPTPTSSNKVYTFPDDEVEYIAPHWPDLMELAFLMSKQIVSDGLQFDRIVSLAKGGWPMARIVADFLHIAEGSSIGARSYTGIQSQNDDLEIYQDLHEVKGERILLFDDVSDSGKTLKYIHDYLQKIGAATVTSATGYYKPHSVFKPDYFGAETSAWIVFPYEVIEMAVLLREKWSKAGVKEEEIAKRLADFRCKKEWLEFIT